MKNAHDLRLATKVIENELSDIDRTNENKPKVLRPTIEAYNDLENAFDFFNEFLFVRLFDARLPNVVLTMPKSRHYQGYFQHRSWNSAKGEHESASEIALNPLFFDSEIEVLQTLTHEMVHLGQAEHPDIFGKPSPRGYHNKGFEKAMITLGLMPSSTGKPGGKTTGPTMSDYVIPGGPFELVFEQFKKMGHEIRWSSSFVRNTSEESGSSDNASSSEGESPKDREREQKRRSKTKYTCVGCGLNIWAKSGVKVACVDCSTVMQEVK